MKDTIFEQLFDVIYERKESDAGKSYVASLMTKGTEKINSKIMEEAGELCDAALVDDKKHMIHEVCDLLFHTFVMAGYKNITLDEIKEELHRRFGVSGIEEKARRKK